MKILFVAVLHHPVFVSTSCGRMEALKQLGHEVVELDMQPYLAWGGRWGGAIFRRWQWGPPLWQLNRDIHRRIARYRPDLVWIDKGPWVFARTLAARPPRASDGPFRIHYTPDPALTFHCSRHFLAAVPRYDLLVTTKAYEIDLYRRHGARDLLCQYPSFDPAVHRPEDPTPEEAERYGAEVAFVGAYAPGRKRYLRPVARMGVDLAIRGGGWRERCRDPELRRHVRGGNVGGRDYALALGCAEIGLGLLSPLVPDRSTTRSLEIPACGGFLLAERTDEHRALFAEGKEAEFFASEQELVAKIRYYLDHEQERERIAAAGRTRCLASGYTAAERVREIMDHARRAMTARRRR
ncbi:MAG: glycosyltransferase family 1 protein [bacterium]|nr:glycosyltransferase family 1 protein [bacterium]